MSVVVTIYRGSTFLMTNPWGEISSERIHGFFHRGLRFLSRYEIQINGKRTFLLSSRALGSSTAVYYLTNIVDGMPEANLHLILERTIDQGLRDRLTLRNYSPEGLDFKLGIHMAADFEDMYRVKASLWQGKSRHPAWKSIRVDASPEEGWLSWACRPRHKGPQCMTTVRFNKAFSPTSAGVLFPLRLGAREEWDISMVLSPAVGASGETSAGKELAPEALPAPEEPPAAETACPILRADWDSLTHAYEAAIRDLKYLQEAAADASGGQHLLAAGIPWFIYLSAGIP